MKSFITLLCLALLPCLVTSQTSPENALEELLPWFSSQQVNVRDFALSPDGEEIYFTVESFKKNISFIVVSKDNDGDWSQPEIVSFSGQFRDIEPAFSPDGNSLYFASNRPLDDTSTKPKDYDIWMVSRENKNAPWSAPKNLGAPVNSEAEEFYPSITTSKNLYFTATLEDTKGREDIYVCEYKDGHYLPPKSLSKAVNTLAYEFNAWVAPDESLIIFSSYGREDGNGGGDLYYSLKDEQGNWQPSLNFDKPVNSDKLDYCPFYDLKTKMLYFTSERTEVQKSYSEKLSFKKFLKEISQSANGLGRIYKVSWEFED
ncbi:MAG: hypothetical protein DWQ02_26325 [Bacteroidetes bacterium]|nr:MAG: hypothetical protein DWQ02_26325 [Bacteroidota bacterium]